MVFDNMSSAVYDDQGDVISWEYNKIDFKELDDGPDDCASGDIAGVLTFLMETTQMAEHRPKPIYRPV